jgi:uncharacterized protein
VFAYLDATVIASLLLDEPGSRKVVEALRPFGRRCIISDFTSAEVSSAVSRRVQTGRESAKIANTRLLAFDRFKADFSDKATLAPHDISTAERLVRAFELKLRAPDAIHLAVCLRHNYRLATLDNNLAFAARALGVARINPAEDIGEQKN